MPQAAAVSLDQLIALVKAQQPDGGPLDHLTDAMEVSGQLSEQADALIGHFVDQARRSGASWSQIGASMGVTKQAAQQRFTPADAFGRFTLRARNTLASAGRLANSAGSQVGPAHIAAALLTEPAGIAALVLTGASIDAAGLAEAVGPGPAEPVSDVAATALRAGSTAPVFTMAGRNTLKLALRSALKLGHNYIGTEHLLLGVLTADDETAGAIAGLGLTAEAAEQAIVAEIARVQAGR
jgi:Clp amino terminal domain, pathogenicity island component